jgi:hypothetical protein
MVSSVAPPARAASIELSGHAGQAFPFYEQTFSYDPGSTVVSVPGVTDVRLDQKGGFVLHGQGGSTIGASLTLYPVPHAGFELRVDSAAVDIRSKGATYHVSIDLPSPLPDVARDFTFAPGVVDVDRLQPISLNLKLKTPGRLAFTVSGGISYLPQVKIDARQQLGLGLTSVSSSAAQLSVGSLVFHAEPKPADDDPAKRIGGNIGAGVRLKLGGPVALTGEGRYFHFPKHKIEWEPEITGPLSAVDDALLAEMRRRLEPLEFYPAFWQGTVGVSLSF